jgi:type I restriction enzyme S subunit
VFIIRTICSIEKKLLFHFIRTLANEYIKSKSKGIIGGVGRTVISNLYFPLPPLAEQKRIVTKVDQLMALCDELESKQQEHHEKLLSTNSACLYSLTTASTKTQPVAEQRLFNHFDKLYTHPQTITDLKKTILQLAVQGKLVPQDPNDEPAAMLLERIKKKRQKKLPPIGFDEYPYELPKAWEWVRLGNVVDQRLGKMLDKQKNRGEPRPYLRNANVRWFSFDLSDLLEMRVEDNEFKDVSVTKGDLVICEGGEPGRTAIWESDKPMVIQKALHRVRPLAGVFNRFLGYIIRADADSGRLEKIFTGATIKHLTGRALVQHLIPFPPFAEQKRIVTKVDQLMALCDELETKLTHANEDVELFAASTVYHLCDWTSNQEVAS